MSNFFFQLQRKKENQVQSPSITALEGLLSLGEMTRFRGCIDLHSGKVKQIVGGTLQSDDRDASTQAAPATNFTSSKPSTYYAELYKAHNVTGTHIIKLGSNEANDRAAKEALAVWPGKFQIGGGITDENAQEWIQAGASHVIVTSWLFPKGAFSLERLVGLAALIGKERIVIDLSCKEVVAAAAAADRHEYVVAINKWQTLTEFALSLENFRLLAQYCSEFLVHAVDVEGLCKGINEELVVRLGQYASAIGRPITYAGGAKNLQDLSTVSQLSSGLVDLTYGSALDIFGGKLVTFKDCTEWNEKI